MKLNHLNLTVSDVAETKAFLETYFGLRSAEGIESDDSFDVLFDDAGLVLTLMKVGEASGVKYPASFHVGFIQSSEEKVNEINQRLKDDGFDVKAPAPFSRLLDLLLQSARWVHCGSVSLNCLSA